jgi:hypothetical protein
MPFTDSRFAMPTVGDNPRLWQLEGTRVLSGVGFIDWLSAVFELHSDKMSSSFCGRKFLFSKIKAVACRYWVKPIVGDFIEGICATEFQTLHNIPKSRFS